MLTEFDYYQHTGRQRKTGLGWLKREGAGGGFFAGASNQISLMKSDWKLQSKNPVPGSGFPFPYPALSALRQICQN